MGRWRVYMKKWIRSLLKKWKQHTCIHEWELHKPIEYYEDEYYECKLCGKQEETDKGTYL